MTRKSRREIEQALNDLDTTTTDYSRPEAIVWKDPETGAWYADAGMDGDPLDPDDVDPLMVLQETIVETDWCGGSDR